MKVPKQEDIYLEIFEISRVLRKARDCVDTGENTRAYLLAECAYNQLGKLLPIMKEHSKTKITIMEDKGEKNGNIPK